MLTHSSAPGNYAFVGSEAAWNPRTTLSPVPACREDFSRMKFTSFDKLIARTCNTIRNVRLHCDADLKLTGGVGTSGMAPDAAYAFFSPSHMVVDWIHYLDVVLTTCISDSVRYSLKAQTGCLAKESIPRQFQPQELPWSKVRTRETKMSWMSLFVGSWIGFPPHQNHARRTFSEGDYINFFSPLQMTHLFVGVIDDHHFRNPLWIILKFSLPFKYAGTLRLRQQM